jgi:hypothetical protein
MATMRVERWLRWPADIIDGITGLCRRHTWLWWVLGGVACAEWVVLIWNV